MTPKPKTARKILEDFIFREQDVNQALSDLADLILAERNMPEIMLSEYGKGWNAACEHLAKIIRGEGDPKNG